MQQIQLALYIQQCFICWQHHYKCHTPFISTRNHHQGLGRLLCHYLKYEQALIFQGHSLRPPCHIVLRPKEGRKRMMVMNNKKQLGESTAAISFAASSLKMSHWDHHFHLLFLMLFFPLQLEN